MRLCRRRKGNAMSVTSKVKPFYRQPVRTEAEKEAARFAKLIGSSVLRLIAKKIRQWKPLTKDEQALWDSLSQEFFPMWEKFFPT